MFAGLQDFAATIAAHKASRPDVPWYPYDSLTSLKNWEGFTGDGLRVPNYIRPGSSVVDLGAADGDTAFFFENLGATVTIVDFPQTNYNDCRGILEMRSLIKSDVRLQFSDLDWTSYLNGQFDLAVCMGILYHLRNPCLILNTLAHCAERLVTNTLVFHRLDDGTDVSSLPLAYLFSARERNNDPTNYWALTPAAFRSTLQRSGWIVKDEFTVGDLTSSPQKGDSRMYCYCERVEAWRDLRAHHDF